MIQNSISTDLDQDRDVENSLSLNLKCITIAESATGST